MHKYVPDIQVIHGPDPFRSPLGVVVALTNTHNRYNYLWTYDLYGPAHKDFDAGGWITL
jgi:hypothetical protein